MAQYTDSGVKAFTSGESLEPNRRVKFNSSRQVVYADADDVGIGITRGDEACTSGAPVTVALWSKGGTFKVEVAGAVTANDILYCKDDGEFDDDNGYGPGCMKALETATADGDIIEAVYIGPKTSGLIYAATADSSNITNTTDETTYDNATKTIDGSTLLDGDVIHIVASFLATDQNSTDTLQNKIYVGTEAVFTSPALDVNADNDISVVDIYVTVRTGGASAYLTACGFYSPFQAAAAAPAEAWTLSAAAEDLSSDVTIKATGTWSVANAGNKVEVENFIVQVIRQ